MELLIVISIVVTIVIICNISSFISSANSAKRELKATRDQLREAESENREAKNILAKKASIIHLAKTDALQIQRRAEKSAKEEAEKTIKEAKKEANHIKWQADFYFNNAQSAKIEELKDEIGTSWLKEENDTINLEKERLFSLDRLLQRNKFTPQCLATFLAETRDLLADYDQRHDRLSPYNKKRIGIEEYCKKNRARNKHLQQEAAYYKYLALQYWSLYPELKEAENESDDSAHDDVYDKEYDSDWLTSEEWKTLSDSEKNQLVLDRYINRHNKSKWQIGRDYELYIGYLLTKQGYHVHYFGIEKKLEDLGRDIIATNGLETLIVQCKYWASRKQIHEKHIVQLYGTTIEYKLSQNRLPEFDQIKPVLYTTAPCSSTAQRFAKALNVEIRTVPFAEFPRIKCNISASGEKIYHLPIDQQYDTTVIEPERGECYATTVAEAEGKGFRRAFRHSPAPTTPA